MPALKFPELEEKILSFWDENKIFEKTLAKDSPRGNFAFFEGPPTANAPPAIHHMLARAFKDLIPRYKTMRGFRVERKAGWDTHGLPVELQVEKALELKNKKDIEAYGIAEFNAKCRESVWEYKKEWERLTKRIGFWLDLERPYITYENSYIESLWWIIKEIWKKGLLYEDYKVVPYCARCGTALSSHEVAQGYKEVSDPSVYVKFKVKNEPNTYFLVWTTTPWTLPANVALAVNPKLTYKKLKVGDEYFYAYHYPAHFTEPQAEVIVEVAASDLIGKKYEPLYDFVHPEKPAYCVIAGDFVTPDPITTGIVHIAPAFGEDDVNAARENDLPVVMTVDADGKFIPAVTPWTGTFVKDADPKIIEELAGRGLLFKAEKYTHEYPFCWRCSTPLLYYAKQSWFIRMSALREKLIAENETIDWTPIYIKEGRFGEWLRGVKDWAFSRERYWGTPLPVWRCKNSSCDNLIIIGSFEELEKLSGAKLEDYHRPFIDGVIVSCSKCGQEMRRVPDVVDVWFDSGAMPFAQWHYPFENKEKIDAGEAFPADYISEAIDQTRGWFYTLLAVAALLDKPAPYRHVVCLGHLLDAKGQKMSKSKGNIVNPWETIERFGADALRWYFFTVSQPGDSKRFDLAGVDEVVKKTFLIFWNVLEFWKTYSSSRVQNSKPTHILDRWIAARLNVLVSEVSDNLDNYRITDAGRKIEEFITELSTWYIRRSRARFKNGGESAAAASAVLEKVIITLVKLMAPFAPFLSEAVYQDFKKIGSELAAKESVHLEDWPDAANFPADEKLLGEMGAVLRMVELGLAIRAEQGIKVRQPLSDFEIEDGKIHLRNELLPLISEELNVKNVHLVSHIEERDDYVVKQGASLTVALCTEIDETLKQEGLLREIVRNVNALRKEAGLKLQDKAVLKYETTDATLLDLFARESQKISTETRTEKIELGRQPAQVEKEVVVDDAKLWLGLIKL